MAEQDSVRRRKEHNPPPFREPRSVPYLIIIGSIGLVLAIAAFFWANYGPNSGRSFGNKIANHINIPKKTFWYLLDNGAKGSSLDLLKTLEKSSSNIQEASIALGPTLQRGLERLEARFGPQEMYEPAKPVISRLVASSNEASRHEASAQSDA